MWYNDKRNIPEADLSVRFDTKVSLKLFKDICHTLDSTKSVYEIRIVIILTALSIVTLNIE